MLAGLFPGRIDLGLGRAPGTDQLTTLRAPARPPRARRPTTSREQLAELLAYLEEELPGRPPVRAAVRAARRPEAPEPWLLGSSPQSAMWAAQLGLPYAFADFINPRGAEIAALYRERFTARAAAEPRRAVAAWAIAPTPTRRPSGSPRAGGWRSRCCAAGGSIPVPPVEKALRFLAGEDSPPSVGPPARCSARPARVRGGLEAVAREYGAQEVIVVTIAHDHAARRRSYELIAEAFGLSRSDADSASGSREWRAATTA